MEKLRYVWLGVGMALVVAVALGYAVTWAQDTSSAKDTGSGRYQIVMAVSPGQGVDAKQVILLDTATGQSWNMKGWNSWKELPRKAAK